MPTQLEKVPESFEDPSEPFSPGCPTFSKGSWTSFCLHLLPPFAQRCYGGLNVSSVFEPIPNLLYVTHQLQEVHVRHLWNEFLSLAEGRPGKLGLDTLSVLKSSSPSSPYSRPSDICLPRFNRYVQSHLKRATSHIETILI